MDLFGNITRFAGGLYDQASDAVKSVLPQMPQTPDEVVVVPTSDVARPDIPANVEQLHDGLSTYEMSDMSGGAIQQMPRTSASALTGNYIVETGDPTLSNTDVVEINAKKGRGLAQYTNARRGPYDQARAEYIAAGSDPNSMDFQMQYAADEYAGKYDSAPGKSLSGFTGTLSGETDDMTVPQAATHFRKDFFRPSVPHNDRRIDEAQKVDALIQQRDQRLQDLSQSSGLKNSGLYIVGERGRDGRYWGGDDYGWQSPKSYKGLVGY